MNADPRSEKAIETLHERVRPLARQLIENAAAAGIVIKIISGTRTYHEQEVLYAQGRTEPGKIVTKAPPGHSNHNFGLAFDVGVFEGSRYIEESPLYAHVGKIGKELGFVWGGDWKSIQDEPHFELHPSWASHLSEAEMLAELRTRHDHNRDAFA